jgi:hypothetical protein
MQWCGVVLCVLCVVLCWRRLSVAPQTSMGHGQWPVEKWPVETQWPTGAPVTVNVVSVSIISMAGVGPQLQRLLSASLPSW